MEGQLWFFQADRALAVENRPEEARQPLCAIRELVHPLVRTLRTPMTKRGFQVGLAQVILHQLKTFKLRHRYLESLTDPFQVAVSALRC